MKEIITDEIWNVIKEAIPKRKTQVGRPSTDMRKALSGIAYVLRNGIYWHQMPADFGKPSTLHGIYMRWVRSKVFENMFELVKNLYQMKNRDNIWYAIDALSKKAPFAKFSGNNPTDRGKRGIKQAIIVDRKGMPITLLLSPASKHDSKLLKPMIHDWEPGINTRILAADSAFDVHQLRQFCKEKNVALIAVTNPRRNKNLIRTKVPCRWIVERIDIGH